MDRRRLLFLATAAGVVAALALLGRPGGGAGDGSGGGADPDPPPPSAPAVPGAATFPDPDPATAPPATPTASPVPVVEHGHGGVDGAEALDPAEVAEAVRAAERFATAWADPAPGWHDRVAGLATPRLAAALSGADPPRPAPEFTGAGRLSHGAPVWARVHVPAVRGTLVLDLVATGGRWLVSAVDWWPA